MEDGSGDAGQLGRGVGVLVGEVDVVDSDVDLDDLQPGHELASDGGGYIGDGCALLDDYLDVDNCLSLTDSTETPWLTLVLQPGTRSRSAPKARSGAVPQRIHP